MALLAALEEAEEAASSASGELKGSIRVAAPVSFAVHCLAPAVGQFLERHPDVSLSIDTDDRMVDLVRDGFDLAIRIAQLPDSSLIARRLVTVRHARASPARRCLSSLERRRNLTTYPGFLESSTLIVRKHPIGNSQMMWFRL